MSSILFKKLSVDAIIPTRGTPNSAGFDLYATHDYEIIPGAGNIMVGTGIAARAPLGHYLRVAIRSGLAAKQHLTVSAGVIDIDYQNEIFVLVSTTHSANHYTIKKGERFAQLIPERISYASARVVDDFEPLESIHESTHEGFGSTGQF